MDRLIDRCFSRMTISITTNLKTLKQQKMYSQNSGVWKFNIEVSKGPHSLQRLERRILPFVDSDECWHFLAPFSRRREEWSGTPYRTKAGNILDESETAASIGSAASLYSQQPLPGIPPDRLGLCPVALDLGRSLIQCNVILTNCICTPISTYSPIYVLWVVGNGGEGVTER